MNEPKWISERAVLAMHERSLKRHGGASGVRDLNLLRSAIARPRQHFAYAEIGQPVDLAAILTAGIVKNHPFVDGNKRTGFMAGVSFLQLNGYRFAATQTSVIKAVLDLAAGVIDEAVYADFLRASTTPSTLSQTPPPGA